MTIRIGIMQGRLVPPELGLFQSFPRQRWRDEFALAERAGLDAIEWIYDTVGEDTNPLARDEGLEEMAHLADEHHVEVRSLCADYFMECPLVRAPPAELADREQRLRWLLARCEQAGIRRIVVPFVDQSRIEGDDEMTAVAAVIRSTLPNAVARGIELHLETSLPPTRFAALLNQIGDPRVKVNYDSGNSASLGYRPADEFAAYGRRIGSVHIKDRVFGGGTVPLGEGDADLDAVFDGLQRLRYDGDYVLQVARAEPDAELAWTCANAETVRAHIRRSELSIAGASR